MKVIMLFHQRSMQCKCHDVSSDLWVLCIPSLDCAATDVRDCRAHKYYICMLRLRASSNAQHPREHDPINFPTILHKVSKTEI
eukprot:4276792-Amphidinium_carterae.1